jgi:hypothetical protein
MADSCLTDRHYLELKALYSFNDQALKNQFLSVSNQINLDNVILAKQHDLLVFRELCFDLHIRCPSELFSFDSSVISQMGSHPLRYVNDLPPGRVSYDLRTEISNVYPGVPWIVDYFILNTFPAIFGHFTSEEYLISGCRFVEAHIRDDLAPQLVGSYLLHCFNFRDRFHDAFFDAVRDSETITFNGLVQRFLDSFRFCVPYFAKSHLQAVSALRRESEPKAFSGVFDHFLIPTIKVWYFSPLFRCTELITQRAKSGTCEYVFLEKLREKAPGFSAQLLDAFQVPAAMPVPRIGSILFYGGVKFSLSVVDGFLLQHLGSLVTGARSATRGSVETAIEDAFRLRTRYSHFPETDVSVPTPTDGGKEMTLQRLEDHKRLHDFLFTHAGGLQQFHVAIESMRKVIGLQYRSYARRLFEIEGCQPTEFASGQRRLYCLRVFSSYVRNPLRDYMTSRMQGDFEEFHGRALQSRLEEAILGKRPIADSVLQGTADYVNEWKQRFSKDFPQSNHGLSNPNKDTDYSQCQYFLEAVDAVTFSLLLEKLSSLRLPVIPKKALSDRGDFFNDFVVRNSDCPELLTVPVQSIEEDPEIQDVLQTGSDIRFLLLVTENILIGRFERGDEFGTGELLLMFLEIESWLRFRLESEMFKRDEIGKRNILAAFYHPDRPTYTRGYLIHLLLIMQMLGEDQMREIPNLRLIGNPIGDGIIAAFENMRRWYGLSTRLVRSDQM